MAMIWISGVLGDGDAFSCLYLVVIRFGWVGGFGL